MEAIFDILKSVLSASSDVAVILALIVAFSAFGLFFGKDRIVSLILSFYVAAFIFTAIPFLNQISNLVSKNWSGTLVRILIFVLISLPVSYVINSFVFTGFPFGRIRKIFEALILGVFATILIITLSYYLIDIKEFYNFSSGVDALFRAKYIVWWLIAPFVALFFMRR